MVITGAAHCPRPGGPSFSLGRQQFLCGAMHRHMTKHLGPGGAEKLSRHIHSTDSRAFKPPSSRGNPMHSAARPVASTLTTRRHWLGHASGNRRRSRMAATAGRCYWNCTARGAARALWPLGGRAGAAQPGGRANRQRRARAGESEAAGTDSACVVCLRLLRTLPACAVSPVKTSASFDSTFSLVWAVLHRVMIWQA